MTLTDIDGVEFELGADAITEVWNRKSFRAVVTSVGDHLLVKERVGTIIYRALEEMRYGCYEMGWIYQCKRHP